MPSRNNIVKPTHVRLGMGDGNMLSKLSVAVLSTSLIIKVQKTQQTIQIRPDNNVNMLSLYQNNITAKMNQLFWENGQSENAKALASPG